MHGLELAGKKSLIISAGDEPKTDAISVPAESFWFPFGAALLRRILSGGRSGAACHRSCAGHSLADVLGEFCSNRVPGHSWLNLLNPVSIRLAMMAGESHRKIEYGKSTIVIASVEIDL